MGDIMLQGTQKYQSVFFFVVLTNRRKVCIIIVI
jgi:hypothetical protein